MTIRIGANPIGWTNDDLQEIGGETPLETCLEEAREAGVEGMEKGHKMPTDGAALKGEARRVRPGLRRRLVLDRIAQALGARGIRSGQGAYRDDQRRRARTSSSRRDLERHPRRPLEAAVASVRGWQRRLGGLRRQDDRIRRAARRRGAEALLSSPHGHDHPVGARHRRLHGPHQAAGASPARHRPRALGRRRSGGARARLSRRASATSIARTCAKPRCAKSNAGDWSFLDSILGMGAELGVYTVPGDGMIDYVGGVQGASRAIPAGSCSKPSRTRRKRPRCPTPRRASRISARR